MEPQLCGLDGPAAWQLVMPGFQAQGVQRNSGYRADGAGRGAWCGTGQGSRAWAAQLPVCAACWSPPRGVHLSVHPYIFTSGVHHCK